MQQYFNWKIAKWICNTRWLIHLFALIPVWRVFLLHAFCKSHYKKTCKPICMTVTSSSLKYQLFNCKPRQNWLSVSHQRYVETCELPINWLWKPCVLLNTLLSLARTGRICSAQLYLLAKAQYPYLFSFEHKKTRNSLFSSCWFELSFALSNNVPNDGSCKFAYLFLSLICHQAKFYEPMEGWLYKKGDKGVLKMWKKRWFYLANNVFSYSDDEKSVKNPLGKITLETATSIRPSAPSVASSIGQGVLWNTEGCYFQIQLPSRNYFLLAESKEVHFCFFPLLHHLFCILNQ